MEHTMREVGGRFDKFASRDHFVEEFGAIVAKGLRNRNRLNQKRDPVMKFDLNVIQYSILSTGLSFSGKSSAQTGR